ncbi:MAG: trypsin-like serine protease [Flavobacteriaceae bacterium]|nr:MAG: trypsin-like serine protease [Flavobacteriaceae bacterium]
MKKVIGLLSIAIIGGIIALSGYKLFFNQPVVIERTVKNQIPTIQSNYKNILNVNSETSSGLDFTVAAERTINSVVHVKNTAVKSGINSWSDLFNGPRKYEQVGTGSGVIISPDGYIVTNNHVIDDATDIEITLNNRKKYKAKLIGTDEKNDIALLKIDEENMELTYIPFADSDNAKIGEWVLAIGNPYNLNSTVTAGIISAKGRDLQGNSNVDAFIQTDAAVNPGNSGGALVNTRGELIGINTAISSRTGSYVGYSFAVPSNIAKKIVDDILEFGSVQEAILGISVDVRDTNIQGVKIGSLDAKSEARKSGLEQGDIIVMINNMKITKFSELTGQLTAKRPGEYVDVTVNRNGNRLTKKVKLSKRNTYVSRSFGWALKNLSKKELKQLDIKGGAKIYETNSRDGDNSLKNFIITKINDKKIFNASEAARLLDEAGKSRYSIVIEMINTEGEKERYRFR